MCPAGCPSHIGNLASLDKSPKSTILYGRSPRQFSTFESQYLRPGLSPTLPRPLRVRNWRKTSTSLTWGLMGLILLPNRSSTLSKPAGLKNISSGKICRIGSSLDTRSSWTRLRSSSIHLHHRVESTTTRGHSAPFPLRAQPLPLPLLLSLPDRLHPATVVSQ